MVERELIKKTEGLIDFYILPGFFVFCQTSHPSIEYNMPVFLMAGMYTNQYVPVSHQLNDKPQIEMVQCIFRNVLLFALLVFSYFPHRTPQSPDGSG